MVTVAFPLAAVLLAIERIAYAAVWRRPDRFLALCERYAPARLRDPVAALRALFCGFKLIQATVFAAWIALHGDWLGARAPVFVSSDPRALALGAVLIAAGQCLNLAVFLRLGATGVFYGSRFGHSVPWVSGFPFSVLAHPQYVGTVATIWGLFLATRFPHADWIALPLLETLYYLAGARLERAPEEPRSRPVRLAGPAPSAHRVFRRAYRSAPK
jgi:phosphatidyl-N-methylethanolamine N-methyltransferase